MNIKINVMNTMFWAQVSMFRTDQILYRFHRSSKALAYRLKMSNKTI